MTSVLEGFLQSLSVAQTRSELHEALSAAAARLGLTRFAYLCTPEDGSGEPVHFTNYPDAWVERYLGREYFRIDPVVEQVQHSILPFTWGRSGDLTPEQHAFFDEAAEYGISSGFSVPIHDGRHLIAAVHFISGDAADVFEMTVQAHRSTLQLIAAHFHAAVEAHILSQSAGCNLSERERYCLREAGLGRTAAEIAASASISPAAARASLKNARLKIGARTTSQAVAKALVEGHIQLS